MSDLLTGYCILALAAIGLLVLTAWASRWLSPRACDVAGVAVVALLYVYIQTMWYDVQMASLLPYSNLVIVGNWLPLFAAVLAGLVWRRTQGTPVRQAVTLIELAVVGAFAAAYPLLGSAPRCGNDWDRMGSCLQTTEFTCSPAAAATLLGKYGISATEQEMADLCLTRSGTSWQGLYRGLKLKTAGTPWDVEVFMVEPEGLKRAACVPLIASVGLDRYSTASSEFTREFGWVPGVNHSVVVEGVSRGGCIIVADPSVAFCREQWDDETVRTLWRGYAMRLVPR